MNIPAEKLNSESGIRCLKSMPVEYSRELREVMQTVLLRGTDQPHYFLDEKMLGERVRIFQEHFMPDSPERKILYAMKANPQERIMTLIKKAGIDGFDCASGGEIDQALGIPRVTAEQIYYNNPVKTDSDTASAFNNGVKYYTVHSEDSLGTIIDQQFYHKRPDIEVAVRIGMNNPDAAIPLPVKYGCTPEETVGFLRTISDARMKASLAMNVGSQNRNPQAIAEGIKVLRDIAQRVGGVESFNLGGGLPVKYFPDEDFVDDQHFLGVSTGAVQRYQKEIFGNTSGENRVIIEPGRALVAPAVDLAVPVLDISRYGSAGRRRLHMGDGALGSFSDAVLHNWRYNFEPYVHNQRTLSGDMEDYDLYGPTCDSGDYLGIYSLPADLLKRDFLLVRNAGAYMGAQASDFNGIKRPKYTAYNCEEDV